MAIAGMKLCLDASPLHSPQDLGLALHHHGLLQMVGARGSCEQHAGCQDPNSTCTPIA